jgi:hypothetical protein
MSASSAGGAQPAQIRAAAAGNAIIVTVYDAPGGSFEASVALPRTAVFDPAVDASGNLANVARDAGAGNLFFTEYDGRARTVRVAGSISSLPPCNVAVIYLSK